MPAGIKRMTEVKKVSVHIVTFNSGKHIQSCLEAVFQQSYPIEQIIVVDNASTDCTLEILGTFADRVETILNQENVGFAAAHNQAIYQSDSDYFLVLNPDVVLDVNYVKHIISWMIEHRDTGSVTGKLLLQSNPQLIDSTGLIITKARRAFDRGALQPAELWKTSDEVFGVSGAASFYRRKMVEEISQHDGQFFDEQFFAYKEDVDVAWRCRLFGWRAFFVADAVAFHERGWKKGARNAQSIKIRSHSYINRYRMMLKNEQISRVLRDLPAMMWFDVASFGYLLLKEPGVLVAWWHFLRDLPSLLRKRKWVQLHRKVKFQDLYRHFES